MARIPQGILGGIRGRIGNVIGAAWKGISYIRSMPLSVANPNTAAQQAQRGAFTQTVVVARLFLSSLVADFWNPFARQMSGYNAFISQNIDSFATAGLETPASFSASRGVLTGFDTLAIVASEASSDIDGTWVDNSETGDALGTDELRLCYYNETQDYWVFPKWSASIRSEETASTNDVVMVENDVLRCYAFMTRPDVSRITDSEYKEVTVAA